jgi:hypothetical protein
MFPIRVRPEAIDDVRQQLAQLGARLEELRLAAARSDPQLGGDFLVRISLDIVHEKTVRAPAIAGSGVGKAGGSSFPCSTEACHLDVRFDLASRRVRRSALSVR